MMQFTLKYEFGPKEEEWEHEADVPDEMVAEWMADKAVLDDPAEKEGYVACVRDFRDVLWDALGEDDDFLDWLKDRFEDKAREEWADAM